MGDTLLRFVIILILLTFSPLAHSENVEGIYQTEANEEGNYLLVSMGSCEKNNNLTCGTIIAAYEKETENKEYEHLDKLIVWDMKHYMPGKYKKGKIWDSSKDKIYKSKMEVSGNNLLVSGCILVICREQTWVGLP